MSTAVDNALLTMFYHTIVKNKFHCIYFLIFLDLTAYHNKFLENEYIALMKRYQN